MSIKRMITGNKACTLVTLTAIGALAGMSAAKMLIKHCSCTAQMKCKAKKAIKAMEDKLLD